MIRKTDMTENNKNGKAKLGIKPKTQKGSQSPCKSEGATKLKHPRSKIQQSIIVSSLKLGELKKGQNLDATF